MVDISNALFSTTDASNNANSPNGYNSSTSPANVVAIEQALRGAIKRLWERTGPAITAGGTSSALTYTPSNTSWPVAYVRGDTYVFLAAAANPGGATLAVNGLTATAILKNSPTGLVALSGGEMQANAAAVCVYDGTQFELINPVPAGVSGYAQLSGATFSGAVNFAQAANIASASTTAIGAATGNYVNITGTTTINAFDTVQAGTERVLNFNSSLTLTYNASSLILPSKANIVTQAGDVARFVSLGSGNWICVGYTPATGLPVASATNVSNYLGFTTSVSGSNGYLKFPGGIIHQWGVVNSVSGGTSQAISWPIPFPNNMFSISATLDGGPLTNANLVASIGSFTLSGATLCNNFSGTQDIFWMAIGN